MDIGHDTDKSDLWIYSRQKRDFVFKENQGAIHEEEFPGEFDYSIAFGRVDHHKKQVSVIENNNKSDSKFLDVIFELNNIFPDYEIWIFDHMEYNSGRPYKYKFD